MIVANKFTTFMTDTTHSMKNRHVLCFFLLLLFFFIKKTSFCQKPTKGVHILQQLLSY